MQRCMQQYLQKPLITIMNTLRVAAGLLLVCCLGCRVPVRIGQSLEDGLYVVSSVPTSMALEIKRGNSSVTCYVKRSQVFIPRRVDFHSPDETEYYVQVVGEAMTPGWQDDQLLIVANGHPYWEIVKTGDGETGIAFAAITLRVPSRDDAEGISSAIQRLIHQLEAVR